MKARLFVDDGVGELRRMAATENDIPFRLALEPWTARGRPKVGETWLARIVARSPDAQGWFVTLGDGPDGFLRASKGVALHEGQLLETRIRAEAWADKGPLLSLSSALPAPGGKVGRAAGAEIDPLTAGLDIIETVEGPPARSAIDAAVNEAQMMEVAMQGGASLAIEATRALTAIDIDAGGWRGAIPDLNARAANEAARQVSLRGLAGLIVIDFIGAGAGAAAEALKQSLRTLTGRRCDVLKPSPLGLVEASVARGARGAAEMLRHTPLAERSALDLLRRLESEGVARRGARLFARAPASVIDWLNADAVGWRAALRGRIGERWTLQRLETEDRYDVWSEA